MKIDRTKLRREILRRYGSLRAFAREAELTQPTLSNFFNGKRDPRRSTLELIMRRLGYDEEKFRKKFGKGKRTTMFRHIDREELRQEIFHRYPTMKAFAMAAGLNANTVSNILSGKREPHKSTVEIMWRTLGYDADEVVMEIDRAQLKREILRRYPSQRKFAKAAGLSEAAVSKILAGQRVELRRRTLALLNRALSKPPVDATAEEEAVIDPAREKLKSEIYRRYWTQKAFAKAAGLRESTVSNLLKGRTSPHKSTLEIISRTLGYDEEADGFFMDLDREKLRREIFRRYTTIRSFAINADLTEETVRNLLTGRSRPRKTTLEIIWRTLGYGEAQFIRLFCR